MSASLYCQECESLAVTPVALGFIDNAGRIGNIDGFACDACRAIWESPSAAPRVTGYVDLEGQTALDFFLARLERRGCNPQPRVMP